MLHHKSGFFNLIQWSFRMTFLDEEKLELELFFVGLEEVLTH